MFLKTSKLVQQFTAAFSTGKYSLHIHNFKLTKFILIINFIYYIIYIFFYILAKNMSSNMSTKLHSSRTKIQGQGINVEILPALGDNFMYLVSK